MSRRWIAGLIGLMVWATVGGVAAQPPHPPVLETEASEAGATLTEVTIFAEADAYIASNRPDENFGDGSGLLLGYSAGDVGFGAERMLLRFDVGGVIPRDATINSARLVLYLNAADPSGDPPMTTVLRRLRSAWGEYDVTWNTEPDWGSIRAQAPVASVPGPYEWDVRGLVTGWVRGNFPNHGVEIIGDESVRQRERLFYARESQSNLEPRLIVDFTVGPTDTDPPTATVEPLPDVSPRTFTVSWTGDDAGGSGVDVYDVRVRVDGGEWATWLSEVTTTSESFTGENGRFYEFEARATDVAGNVEPFSGEPEAGTRIDSEAPSARVNRLPARLEETSFTVSWRGEDGETEIACYDVQVRVDDGPWTLWQDCTPDKSALYQVPDPANPDGLYAFEARARDVAGNVEPFANQAEASTAVDIEPPFIVPRVRLPVLLMSEDES